MEKQIYNPVRLGEKVTVEVFRGRPDGYHERPDICEAGDLIVNNGRIFLAQRIGANVNSPMAHMAVGTSAAAAGLTDANLPGEVRRKTLAVNSALTNNVYTAVATFGGFADSVTSLNLQEAGLFNHANSGQGTMFQRVTYANVTLGNSDLLRLTLETNVGSNTI